MSDAIVACIGLSCQLDTAPLPCLEMRTSQTMPHVLRGDAKRWLTSRSAPSRFFSVGIRSLLNREMCRTLRRLSPSER